MQTRTFPRSPAQSKAKPKKDDTDKEDGTLLIEPLPGESEQEFYRRRTNLYNKRAYQKRQRNVQAIKRQGQELERINQGLRQENERLQSLVNQALVCLAAHHQYPYGRNAASSSLSLMAQQPFPPTMAWLMTTALPGGATTTRLPRSTPFIEELENDD